MPGQTRFRELRTKSTKKYMFIKFISSFDLHLHPVLRGKGHQNNHQQRQQAGWAVKSVLIHPEPELFQNGRWPQNNQNGRWS